MSPQRRETQFPNWLWFFLILPAVLVVALLWRRRAQQVFRMRFGEEPAPERYTEPDSIPLEVHAPEEPHVSPRSAERTGSVLPFQATGPDDLKIIEGIGPAISGILRDSEITTFSALADTPVELLEAILVQAKLRRLADPATWPEQARLARDGKWEALETLQRSLKAGRRKNDL